MGDDIPRSRKCSSLPANWSSYPCWITCGYCTLLPYLHLREVFELHRSYPEQAKCLTVPRPTQYVSGVPWMPLP